ncbi:histone deacetylase HDT1 [Trifolium repens]|nr:histone deacetylase HDT1 [Trifolium repens]
MEAPMEFWGTEVKVGQSVKVDPDDEQYEGYIHISQVALGEVKKGKATEPVVVYVKVDDQKLVLGTLIKDEIPQISLDIVLEKEAELSHNSKNAAVYFSGYKVFRGMDEDDEDADFSDSDGELAPMRERVEAAKELAKSGKPAAQTGAVAKQVKIIDPTSGKTVDPEEIKDLSGDESDSDFSEEFNSDSEDGESEEETPAKKVDQGKKNKGTNENAPKAPDPTKKAKIATPEKTDSDVDSSDEDISDEDISDEDISDDDSSDEETPVQKGKNNKRPNEAGPQTPVSAKKAKNATPGKTGDGKKGVHIATPHPMKKGGKTPQNAAKNQSPSSNKSKKSNQGRR